MAKRSVACSVANILLNGTNIGRSIKEQRKDDFKKDLKNIRENCHKLRNKSETSETRETSEKNERSSLRNSLKSMGETGLDVANIGFALAGHPEVSAAAGLAKTAHAHREKTKSKGDTSPESDKPSPPNNRKVMNPMNAKDTKGGGYRGAKKRKHKKTMKRKTKRKKTKRRKNISRTRKI
tara:strand:+ start:202 stop:741 length:540 start_codon:yes stop_codon:yes gene_type:complete